MAAACITTITKPNRTCASGTIDRHRAHSRVTAYTPPLVTEGCCAYAKLRSVIMASERHLLAYARVARRTYTEYAPAGTPHASAQNLTLGVVCIIRM